MNSRFSVLSDPDSHLYVSSLEITWMLTEFSPNYKYKKLSFSD